MPKDKVINLRIDADLKKRAKKLAEEDGRSLSNWITSLIQAEVKKARRAKDAAKQAAAAKEAAATESGE